MTVDSIIVAVVAALLSGLTGVIISNRYYQKQQIKNIKLDLLKKVVGYAFQLTPQYKGETNDIITSINQIVVVFNNSKKVMGLLKQYKDSKRNEDLIRLIKGMCYDLKVRYIEYGFNDEFFLMPFTFNEACRN